MFAKAWAEPQTRQRNKDKIKIYHQNYYRKHKDRILKQNSIYYRAALAEKKAYLKKYKDKAMQDSMSKKKQRQKMYSKAYYNRKKRKVQ